ncbi:MAG: hypothetical protein N3E36_07280 [Sulfolobales archaeon]|nr:hypothetical protein [Ignisphaera sp.]MCX8199793.1 hypothetical protein [Sulfolobales archaeon]MDW8084968.1 hypothetical protein [Ignisphaera sp.]
MDLTVLSILTISMLSVAILTTLTSIRRGSVQLKNSAMISDEASTIKKGYAYTVDMGDALLIVAVIDKNNSNGIMSAYENPLEVRSIANKV